MKRNPEGNTWPARWKKAPRGYVAWLEKLPKQPVRGGTEEALKEQLWELALEHFGDGEACIELVPPLPAARAGAGYFEPQWFKLGSNEGLRNAGDHGNFYTGGWCSFCQAGLGRRNATVRALDAAPRSDHAFIHSVTPNAWIVTEAFVKFFGPRLGPAMRTIPCTLPKPSRKKFFELVLTGSLELATPKDATDNGGLVCPKCSTARYSFFVCERIKKGLAYGVSKPALLARKGPAHVLASASWPKIIIDGATAARLRKTQLKGVLLDRLALIPAGELGQFPLRKLTRKDV